MIDKLRNICLKQFHKLLFDGGRLSSESEFEALMNPYCQLLFQLIFVKDNKSE